MEEAPVAASLRAVHLDLALAGLIGGFVVGLTGMGGGALMTPMLVLIFHIDPLTAVSSDLVVSLVMKPVGAVVHMRKGTINRPLVGWLMLGSMPSAFAGVLVIRAIGDGAQDRLKVWLGVALLISATTILVKIVIGRRLDDGRPAVPTVVRPGRTVAIGVLGGLMVGMTSVGSGSLIIIMLMLVYPDLSARELVGTDLAQAIPLVGSAALGHALFGDVHLDLTGSLLVGGIPGIFLGSHLSAVAPDRIVRPALFLVLLGTGLKLVGAL